jgi:hypothetical protein
MNEQTAGRALPPLLGLIAGGLVVAGVFLSMFVAEGFLAMAGLGAFGPGILRELGLLTDQDEFQRQAARRAGYHAYLVGGLVTVLVVAFLRSRGADFEISSDWVTLILLALWTTWLFSALLDYWGARKTAARVLIAFGSFWAVFVAAHIVGALTGPEPLQVAGVLVGLVLVGPFFLLAWTATRWPRGTGGALLAVSALFLVVFGPRWTSGALQLPSVLVTVTLLLVPLVASGIALLRDGTESRGGPDVAG